MTPEEQERIMDQEDRRLKEELFARLDEDYCTTYGPERIGLTCFILTKATEI